MGKHKALPNLFPDTSLFSHPTKVPLTHSATATLIGTSIFCKDIKHASTSVFLYVLFLLSWMLSQSYLQYHFIRKAFFNSLFQRAPFIILIGPLPFLALTITQACTHTHTHPRLSFPAMYTPIYVGVLLQSSVPDGIQRTSLLWLFLIQTQPKCGLY